MRGFCFIKRCVHNHFSGFIFYIGDLFWKEGIGVSRLDILDEILELLIRKALREIDNEESDRTAPAGVEA
jgi:hypothetical protein